ncbi:hypothetical protein niasHS_003941 [Heterodera schachtii]|uniref:Endonuclease/exonuclease/phosphatase domain-containing protein n=1 Tax=Heterodera schachtii TaxID=97005 RepID=A0ABD2K459_HETSC
MPSVNRIKRDHLLKLRSKARQSESNFKKPATKKYTERKRQLEDSFSNINAELISQSELPHNAIPSSAGLNIFMDILKVRQVIELDDEEQTPNQIEGSEGEPREEQQKHKKRRNSEEKTPIGTEEVLVISEQNSAESLLPKEMSKCTAPKQNGAVMSMDLSNSLANKTDLTDLDLRMVDDPQQCLPSSSGASSSVPVNVQPPNHSEHSLFISRARFDARAPAIDLRMRYKLNGLRYFQDIPGKDLRGNGTDPTFEYEKKPLKIVSFNVLCQRTMDKMPHLYMHLRRNDCSREWEQRKKNLSIEFDRLDADVFCLQEVQDIHFKQYFLPFFTARGFNALFTPRKGIDMPDGCAAFWRSTQLALIKSNSVYYNLGVTGMEKDNVGQVLAFSIVGTRSAICISNTHIYFNMKHGHIKLAQMAYLLGSMHQMESQICADSPKFSHFIGHILCGDFNIHPGTPLHKFIIERSVELHQNPSEMAWFAAPSLKRQTFPVSLKLPVHRMRISSKCTFVDKENIAHLLDLKTVDKLTHPFTFASVYEHWNVSGEPEVSIYHFHEAEAPDFIFYSVAEQRNIFKSDDPTDQKKHSTDKTMAYESFIRLVKRLSMPTKAQLDCACGPLPNAEHGSDHLSLWANFELLVLPL